MTNDPHAAPRRMKAYTGGQGYVYQYYFVGKRPTLADDAEAPGAEFIFDVTSDRKTTFAVSVFLKQAALDQWAAAHRRALTEAEQYAAAKLRLFQAFDEVEDMMGQGRRLVIGDESLVASLATLGVE